MLARIFCWGERVGNESNLVVWRLILEIEFLNITDQRMFFLCIQPCSLVIRVFRALDAKGLTLHHHSQVQLGEWYSIAWSQHSPTPNVCVPRHDLDEYLWVEVRGVMYANVIDAESTTYQL